MLIAEIARRAGVSPATVSRALNLPHLVGSASLARIESVIKEEAYVPRRRRRRPKSHRRIGVWLAGGGEQASEPPWALDELRRSAALNLETSVDLRIGYSTTPGDPPKEFLRGQVDGVIITGAVPSDRALHRLGDVPRVWFMSRPPASVPDDFVDANEDENGRLAAHLFKNQGHHALAAVAGDPRDHGSSQRAAGFVAQASEYTLVVHEIPRIHAPAPGGALSVDSALRVARQIIESETKPTGLYLPSDHCSGALFRALRELGWLAGRDFQAVLGSYTPNIYHNLDHSPAVIATDVPTLIRKLFDQLFWRMHNPKALGRVGVLVSPRHLEFGM